MKTILMPTDGSSAADKALDLALDLAKLHDASLKILHVLLRDKEPWELLRLPEMSNADPELVAALKEMEQAPAVPHMADEIMANPNVADRPVPDAMLHAIGGHVMARAVGRAQERGIPAHALEIAESGTAAAIIDAAKEQGADTIVMGTRGLRQIDAITFGSVSQEVCRLAPCTCIAVH